MGDDCVPMPRPTSTGMRSTRLTVAEADIARWLWNGLFAGVLRAHGRRVVGNPRAPYEWIPRAEWERVTDLNSDAWDQPFCRSGGIADPFRQSGGRDAFRLHAGDHLWSEVRIMLAEVPTDAEIVAELDGGTVATRPEDRQQGSTSSTKAQASDRGGAPRGYDRAPFEAEFHKFRAANPSANKRAVTKHMQTWCSFYGQRPSPQWVRQRVTEEFKASAGKASEPGS
jgi:hypothetical protein